MNWPTPDSLPDLSTHQREQYALATGGDATHLCILGGRPGTGKTFTLARILSQVPSDRTVVGAPTGKAAVRVSETLAQAGVEGLRASTIHSMLGVAPADGGFTFKYNELNPLPYEFIFIDESSMVDVPLMASLLAARAPGAKVMLIGDVNQLAPVGHGAPLRDLRQVVPAGELLEIQRNSGRIVKCCHEIIDKHTFTPSAKFDLDAGENLVHIERREPEQQIETLKGLLEKFRGGHQIGGHVIDPVWDCQVLVPINDKSPLGRRPLNVMLQGLLNPDGERLAGHVCRVGDKVVNGRNGWFPVEILGDWTSDADEFPNGANKEINTEGKVFCCNGDVGKVLALFPKYMVVRLWSPDRIIRVPKGENSETAEGEPEAEGRGWDLAYAISVHKSQGSEYPICITMADGYGGARRLCDRSWLYTALSRAKVMAVTIGQRELLRGMCAKSHIWNRKTFLRAAIEELEAERLGQQWSRFLEEVV